VAVKVVSVALNGDD